MNEEDKKLVHMLENKTEPLYLFVTGVTHTDILGDTEITQFNQFNSELIEEGIEIEGIMLTTAETVRHNDEEPMHASKDNPEKIHRTWKKKHGGINKHETEHPYKKCLSMYYQLTQGSFSVEKLNSLSEQLGLITLSEKKKESKAKEAISSIENILEKCNIGYTKIEGRTDLEKHDNRFTWGFRWLSSLYKKIENKNDRIEFRLACPLEFFVPKKNRSDADKASDNRGRYPDYSFKEKAFKTLVKKKQSCVMQ